MPENVVDLNAVRAQRELKKYLEEFFCPKNTEQLNFSEENLANLSRDFPPPAA